MILCQDPDVDPVVPTSDVAKASYQSQMSLVYRHVFYHGGTRRRGQILCAVSFLNLNPNPNSC